MIHFCSCSKNSSSPFENPKQLESLKSCKICGGRLLVDGRGAQQGSMLSNGGLELSRVIDPHLSWKTASNGRQRAVRRARTSFTGANRKNSPAKSFKASKDLMDKDSKDTEDMPVSESEKVGVSILGRRFSDTLGSVPIKKRRFLLAHSLSPPCHSSSYSDDSGHIWERKTVSNQGAMLKQHSFDTNSISGLVLSQEGKFGVKKTDVKGVNEKVCDAADFSGISILAAAACDSNIGGEFMNDKCSLPEEPFSEVQGVTKEDAKIDFLLHDKEETVPHTSEDLVGRTDLPFELSSSSVLPSKESNEVKSDGSTNLEMSVNSFQNVLKTTVSPSCDVRFHWDLNTVADAWEGHEESLNSDRDVTDNVNKDGDQMEKLGIVETIMDRVGFGDTKNVPICDSQIVDAFDYLATGEQVIHSSEMKTEEKPDIFTDNSAADSKEIKHFLSKHGDIPAKVDSTCSVGDFPSAIRGTVVFESAVVESSLSSNVILEDRKAEAGKAEAHLADFHPKVETENSSCLVSCDNTILGRTPDVSALNPGMDRKHIEFGTAQMAEITQTRSSQAVKHESACVVDSGTIKTNENTPVCCLSEKCPEVQAHGNIHDNLVTGCVNSDANADMNYADETGCRNTNKSKEKDDYDDMDVERNDIPTDIGFKVSDGKSVGITSDNTDASLPLSSQGDLGSASDSAPVAVENHLDKQCYPDASQNDHDQEPGMEKVEFLGDDDSQYEDGEFRESLANCWLDDGEEGETEHVDYGSDRDTDFCDAASDFSSVNRQVNNMGLSDASQDIQHREVGKDTQNTSRLLMNCSSLANLSDAGLGKSNAGSAMGTGLLANRAAGNDVGDNRVFKEADDARSSSQPVSFRKMSGWDRLPGGYRGSCNGMTDSKSGSIARNHNDTSSGPSRAGDSMNRAVGLSLRRDLSSRVERVQSSDMPYRNDKPFGRPSRSNDRNGFNSRVDRDRYDPRSIGRGGPSRSIGRGGPSMHLQGRGRGDHWADSSYHGNNRNDSSGYYGSANFSLQGSSNAAAAAVAKVESNGFVVAPDGTIVKAGGPGSAGHVTQRSVKGPSQNTHRSPMGRGSPVERERSFGRPSGPSLSREMNPDRPLFSGRGKPGRYGPRMDGASHKERYRGPMPDGIIDSVSMHHTISRRDQSFSPPHRRPLHLSRSHSRSPSRSRTRSPQRWASPRGRSDNGMNGGPCLWQRSRSPNFKSDARMDRPRAGFGERIASYSSLSRNHTSPPHALKWIDERKEASEHFRDYEYRRGPGRSSPPARVFSRGRRFDLMDSPGRLKPDEYCRPTNSGRFPEFVGFGRGSKHDGKGDDRRGRGDRYEMLHPARRYVNDGNMKRLRYDNENGVMAPILPPRSLEFQRRESPRAFDRSTDRQLGDSPRRSKEEKGHLRNGGDGNHNTNCKSFGTPDADDDMNAQRKPQ